MPKVSIITPAYNITDEQYSMSLSSIQAQTSKDFEWIVVADGENSHFHHWADIRTEENFGPSVARNLGFQISSGDIITYLDMGDELNPQRVENLISLFDKNKCQILFSAYYIYYPDNKYQIFNHFNYIGTKNFPTAFEYVQVLQKQNFAIPLGVAHTRWPFVLVGGFQRGIVCGEDGILWRRMVDGIELNQILFSDDLAGTYYVSETGQSRTQRRFEMGGFAFDGSLNDNGKYLDEEWYANFSSKEHYD